MDNERVRYLTEDEEQRLFMAMGDNVQLKDIVTVALHTGMRRGEIFNLKWFDLDFDRGVMHVRKTKTKLNRVVPMNVRVREVLNRQKRSSEFVFTSEKTGGRLIDVKKAFIPLDSKQAFRIFSCGIFVAVVRRGFRTKAKSL